MHRIPTSPYPNTPERQYLARELSGKVCNYYRFLIDKHFEYNNILPIKKANLIEEYSEQDLLKINEEYSEQDLPKIHEELINKLEKCFLTDYRNSFEAFNGTDIATNHRRGELQMKWIKPYSKEDVLNILRKYKIVEIEYGTYGEGKYDIQQSHVNSHTPYGYETNQATPTQIFKKSTFFYIVYVSINGDCFGSRQMVSPEFIADWINEIYNIPFEYRIRENGNPNGNILIKKKEQSSNTNIISKKIVKDLLSKNLLKHALFPLNKCNPADPLNRETSIAEPNLQQILNFVYRSDWYGLNPINCININEIYKRCYENSPQYKNQLLKEENQKILNEIIILRYELQTLRDETFKSRKEIKIEHTKPYAIKGNLDRNESTLIQEEKYYTNLLLRLQKELTNDKYKLEIEKEKNRLNNEIKKEKASLEINVRIAKTLEHQEREPFIQLNKSQQEDMTNYIRILNRPKELEESAKQNEIYEREKNYVKEVDYIKLNKISKIVEQSMITKNWNISTFNNAGIFHSDLKEWANITDNIQVLNNLKY
jgi:hypothetical protein